MKQLAYKRDIIKNLYFNQNLSCAELSELTQKSLPLTTKILNELIDEDVVVETGYANSTGGRRPLMYSLKPGQMYLVAVAMDQLITQIVIMDMENNYVGEVKKVDLKLTNNPDDLNELVRQIEDFIINSTIPRNKIAGIGVGMPGFLDVMKGINHSFLKTEKGQTIVTTIESATGIPVHIDNDSNLIALAELRFGAARNRQNVMVVNVGWGVGLGIILQGEIFRGYNGFAGELSHISLFSNNKMCNCGKSGCLETEASLVVIVEKAIQGLQEGKLTSLTNLSSVDVDQSWNFIKEAALKGDKFSIELLSDVGYNIGRGIAILIHLLNPELVVISGRGSLAGKLWLAPIQQAIHEHCIPNIAKDCEIEISSIGNNAELIGVAALVMEHYN